MATTTIYAMSSSMDDTSRLVPKMTVSGKMKHRPRTLNIDPFDPDELNRKLNVVVTGKFHEPQLSPCTQLSGETLNSPSPRSASIDKQSQHISSRSRKNSTANAAPQQRRGSLLDRLGFGKGSNYSEKEAEEERSNKPAPYKHVPKVAAEQFARTTTVEPLAQKASTAKQMRPSPGPHAIGTFSLQDYNKQCKRSQSLCSGRVERAGSHHSFNTVLESTAEVDEEPLLTSRSAQPHVWNSGFELGPEASGRRMSTGNMWGKQDSLQPHVSFRRDSAGLVALHMQKSNNSLNSGMRRGSNSSSTVFSFDNASPFQRESGPVSPFRSEFGSVSPMREDSGNSSRRGSVAKIPNPQATANLHRPDWSQSDQSTKQRRDSKWSINSGKSRKASLSQKSTKDENEISSVEPNVEVDAPLPTKSPKNGFLRRFRH